MDAGFVKFMYPNHGEYPYAKKPKLRVPATAQIKHYVKLPRYLLAIWDYFLYIQTKYIQIKIFILWRHKFNNTEY